MLRSPSFLRPVIELAIGVARQGEVDDPAVPAPSALRPFLSFAKLPPAALDATRRVLEHDEAFRVRVLEAADEERVGRAGWLWLERPEGWEEQLAELVGAANGAAPGSAPPAAGGADPEAEVDARRRARRQLVADAAHERLQARAQRAEEDLDRVKGEASELRRANRRLAVELERTEAQVVQLTEERTRAVRQLKAVEATLAERALEARSQRDEIDRLRDELAASRELLAAAEARAAGLPAPGRGAAPATTSRGGGVADVDLGQAARTVADASAAADRLATALSDLAGILAPRQHAAGAAEVVDGAGQRPVKRRRAVRLAGGAVDDSPQAALYLARLPGALFLVDGYNVSKTAWPELELPAQRLRLVNAVAELRARLGTQVEVVFDGADEGRLATRALPSSVRVWFSPESVEADDLILSLVEAQPPERSVVVVSSDRRVKDGARVRGASVLSSATFLTVLR